MEKEKGKEEGPQGLPGSQRTCEEWTQPRRTEGEDEGGRGEVGEVDEPPAPGGLTPTASDSGENDHPAHDSLRKSTPEGLAHRISKAREKCGGQRGEEDG